MMDSKLKNNKFNNIDHYIGAANSPQPDSSMTLVKQNQQLRALIMLHLDLIQEHAEQAEAKDKMLNALREENERLKAKIEKLEKKNAQEQKLKKVSSPNKILTGSNEEKKENCLDISNKGVCKTIKPIVVPPSATTTIPIVNENCYKVLEESAVDDSIIGEQNGKFISKIVLHRVADKDGNEIGVLKTTATESDDGCDSNLIVEKTPTKRQAIAKPQPLSVQKYGIVSTKKQYCTREWELEEFMSECNKEEAEALKSDEPMLEIPKWTTKEFSGLYSIEGTENLTDSAFDKRHAKLEHDEKRRKKWDVQRIREQKTIERLKRRHCKDELAEQLAENHEFQSFYPTPDQIKFIQITEDLPVQAFGDGIPDINGADFTLPWSNKTSSASVEMQLGGDLENLPSSFVFLKKRKRHHSTMYNKKLARIRDSTITSGITTNATAQNLPVTSNTVTPTTIVSSTVTTAISPPTE